MSAESFYDAMIEKLRRRPFRPFAVDLNDGCRLEIDRPHSVSIRGGAAACATKDCIYVRVDCEEVKQVADASIQGEL